MNFQCWMRAFREQLFAGTRRFGVLALLVLLAVGGVAPRRAAADKPDPAAAIEAARRHNLRNLGYALCSFLRYNEGKLPAKISELHSQGFVLDLQAFVLPGADHTITDPRKIDEQTDYELLTKLSDKRPLLLAREKVGPVGGKALAFYSDQSFQELEAATKPTEATLVAVPNVVGLTAAEAKAAMLKAGLKPSFTVGDPSSEKGRTVYRSEPASGAKVSLGSAVKLTIHAQGAP